VFELDKLENPGKTIQGEKWYFFTDSVMGGLSSGGMEIDEIENIKCYRITGNVTTENNGGFIQIRAELNPKIKSENYSGVYLSTYGNNKKYAIHLRTTFTIAPWQYYTSKFVAKNEWVKINLPFETFTKSNYFQPKQLSYDKIKSIGVVAAFDNFKADISISEIGFY
tara:strand:- start:41 stop:541 length:501 start_codon:yes stop_codon:yes gene_type:complete